MSVSRSLAVPGALVALSLLIGPRAGECSDFTMSLQVRQEKRQAATTHTRQQPSPRKQKPRQILKCEAGKLLRIHWKAANTAASEAHKNILVHFFVVREKKPGQPNVPTLGKDVEHEGALTMDFKPGDKAEGEFTLRIRKAGSFLVRVETIGMLVQHGHEHFAALDLVVK